MTSATLSQAAGSRSRPPRTACSASMECGGCGASASDSGPDSRRTLAGPATDGFGLFFGDDRHCQRHIDIGVQVQNDRMVANRPQGSVRESDLATLDRDARLGRSFRDIGCTDGAEELALGSRLRRDNELELFQRLGALLRRRHLLVRRLLELRTPRLEALDVVRRGQRGLAMRQQVVAAEAGLHFDAIANVAQVGDFLEKNDVHLRAPQCWSVYGSRARKRARLIATASWR